MSMWLEAMTRAMQDGDYGRIREVLLPMAPKPMPQCMYREMEFAERCCRDVETDPVFPIRFLWLLDGHEQFAFGLPPSGLGVYHPEKLLDFWTRVIFDADLRAQHETEGMRLNLEDKALDLGRGWIYIGDRFVEDLFAVESCLGGELLFKSPETGENLPVFRAQRLHKNQRVAQNVAAVQVSRNYTLGFLAKHPASKLIVLKHLAPLGLGEDTIVRIEGTLREMSEQNMGGGIPYSVIVPLMNELDQLPVSAFEDVTR